MCGRPIQRRDAVKITLEGAILTVCPTCAHKLRIKRRQPIDHQQPYRRIQRAEVKSATPTPKFTRLTSKHSIPRKIYENYEVVPDYAKRIREARQRLGWSTRILAEKVGEPESVIKRIEDGRLTPTIDMALKFEKVLKIKLLQPIVDEYEDISKYTSNRKVELTLGDIANIRVRNKNTR